MNQSKHPALQADKYLSQAVTVLRAGGVVAFPTETCYGLAVDPFNQQALARLFAGKQRATDKAVLLLIRARSELSQLAREIPPPFAPLMDRFWPGPLTLVFPARADLPPPIVAADQTIALRISSHPMAERLLAAFGGPLTATSANLSGHSPALNPEQVRRELTSGIDYLLDGGSCLEGGVSTIVGYRNGALRLIREGIIPFAQITKLCAKGTVCGTND